MYIVITDFDGYEQTRRCLKALEKSEFIDFAVILVAHGTTEETPKRVSIEFPGVECISASSDCWWAGATNIGITRALQYGAERVVLLNNDCYVEQSTLETLVGHADLHPTSIIAPLQKSFDTGLISTAVIRTCFLLGFPTVILDRKIPEDREDTGLVAVELIRGGRGVIIPAAVFNAVGLLNDKDFPHYYADHDFYLRARERNVQLYLAVDAVVEVDDTRTSVASDAGAMSLETFLASFTIRRSHRNVEAIRAIFKNHYPVPRLYIIGISLYYARYVLVYILARSARLLGLRKVW